MTDTNRAAAETEIAPYRRFDERTHPPLLFPDYASTVLRAPKEPLIRMPHTLSEVTGPLLGEGRLGERIIVHGRVLEGDGRPVPNTLVEIWQANSAGRYLHEGDQHPAPLDPNFTGVGRCMTDAEGRYRFITIKPGAYPWRNHPNAWRAAHIHMSLFGPAFATRLVTQMYFPGDPLFFQDPIFHSVSDADARLGDGESPLGGEHRPQPRVVRDRVA